MKKKGTNTRSSKILEMESKNNVPKHEEQVQGIENESPISPIEEEGEEDMKEKEDSEEGVGLKNTQRQNI